MSNHKFAFIQTIALMFSSYNEHKKAGRCWDIHQQLCNGEATAHDVAQFQQFLHGELSRTDGEARYWLDCIDDLASAIIEAEAKQSSAAALLQLISLFRTQGKIEQRRRAQKFYDNVTAGVVHFEEAKAFSSWLSGELLYSEHEAIFKAIWAILQDVAVKHNQIRQTTGYLSNKPGEVQLYAWDKRHWMEAPAPVQQFIQSYLDLGWSVTHCKTFNRNRLYEFQLVQHRTLIDNSDQLRSWHHHKQITLDSKAKEVHIRNGQSSHNSQPKSTEPEASDQAQAAKPKRQRRKKAQTV